MARASPASFRFPKAAHDMSIVIRVKQAIKDTLIGAAGLAAPALFDAAFRLAGRGPFVAAARRAGLKHGVHVMPRHYYSPIPDAADFPQDFWDAQSEMPGVTIDEARAIEIMTGIVPRRAGEMRKLFPIERTGDAPFWLINGVYMAVDAHVYWSLIRETKPARIVEIGSGMSTQLAAAACAANAAEGASTKLVSIEPYPSNALQALAASGKVELIARKVQDVPLDFFAGLGPRDILFIDSSHVLREGNDVQYEYLEILPRLKKGVLVHIHDISLPRRYPRVYFDNGTYWNEQYLLQAYLCGNPGTRVVWPGNWMMLRHRDGMLAAFPEIEIMRRHYPSSEPSAFWFEVV